jgi:4-hydroxybenzoate polyprenyltransferase
MDVSRLLVASRPRLWTLSLGAFALGASAGAPSLERLATPEVLVWAFFFLFPANLFSWGLNDLSDASLDRSDEKKTAYADLTRPDARRALSTGILVATAPFLLALPADPRAGASVAAFVLLGAAYSLPPARLKARFPADLLASVRFGAVGWHLLRVAPDEDVDRLGRVRTSAVALGGTRAILLSVLAVLGAAASGAAALGWIAWTGAAIHGLIAGWAILGDAEAREHAALRAASAYAGFFLAAFLTLARPLFG